MKHRVIPALILTFCVALGVAALLGFLFVRSATTDARLDLNRASIAQACRDQHAHTHTFRLFLEEGTKQFELRSVSRENFEELEMFRKAVREYLRRGDCLPPGHKPHHPYSVLDE